MAQNRLNHTAKQVKKHYFKGVFLIINKTVCSMLSWYRPWSFTIEANNRSTIIIPKGRLI
jgi:hypothetical protein